MQFPIISTRHSLHYSTRNILEENKDWGANNSHTINPITLFLKKITWMRPRPKVKRLMRRPKFVKSCSTSRLDEFGSSKTFYPSVSKGLVVYYLCIGWPFWESLENFQTDPPLHLNFFKMTPHKFDILWKWPSPPPNILARNWAEVHHMLNITKISVLYYSRLLPQTIARTIVLYHRKYYWLLICKINLMVLLKCITWYLLLLDKLYSLWLWSRDWIVVPKIMENNVLLECSSSRLTMCGTQPYYIHTEIYAPKSIKIKIVSSR